MLSSAEQNAVKNPEYILTKNSIINKVATLFGELSMEYASLHNKLNTPKFALQLHPKISKGENYLGLPYLMLDFPRIFEKNHVFAIRSFFWWGNYFSITLHVKGKYKPLIHLKSMVESNTKWMYYIGIDEWENNVHVHNLLPISSTHLDFLVKDFQEKSFVRVVQLFDLSKWDNVKDMFLHAYTDILQTLDTIHLYGE